MAELVFRRQMPSTLSAYSFDDPSRPPARLPAHATAPPVPEIECSGSHYDRFDSSMPASAPRWGWIAFGDHPDNKL